VDLFYILLVLLVVTRAFGEIAERLGQPSLVGELIGGIALGAAAIQFPDYLPDLTHIGDNPVFVTVTDLAMFFLMLFAGLEMQPHKVFERSVSSLLVAVGGMIVPLGLGVCLGWAFLPHGPLLAAQCLFLGTALAITAVPATVRILSDLGQLNSKVGQTIVSAAVFDDILSLLLLSWLTAMITAETPPGLLEFAFLSAKIVVFFLITSFIGMFVFPWGGRFIRKFRESEHDISAVLVGAFAFAVLAELLGLQFIVGAFMAGLFFGRKTINRASYDKVHRIVSGMTFGFLAPIFFASIGLSLDLQPLAEAPLFVLLLIGGAMLGKIVGAGAGARLFGYSWSDSVAVGVGMSPRGAVELVIAGIALRAGLFEGSGIVAHLYSAVVLLAVVTTLVSPLILEWIFARSGRNRPDPRPNGGGHSDS